MKIAQRRAAVDKFLGPQANREAQACIHQAFPAWPLEFNEFLQTIQGSSQCALVEVNESQEHVSVQHGKAGAQVTFTLNAPLEQSWRVAAFHSNKIATLSSFDATHLEPADGLMTDGAHFKAPLMIQTADCLAVAITLENSHEIFLAACFHAGWRGYSSGIQQVVLDLTRKQSRAGGWQSTAMTGLDVPSLFVTIGPAIAGSSYPCGADVLDALRLHHENFLLSAPHWSQAHEKAWWQAVGLTEFEARGKIYPDLQALMCIELHASGVDLNSVTVLREDTLTSSLWPSHRRAMAQGMERAGRLFTHLCPPACPRVPNHVSNP
ncbi:laccase domain-containing protein [bacterium]|nr:laccase domain-containing protein [bacterium]